MKKHLLILSPLLFLITSFMPKEEYFEGVIVYKHTYQTENPDIDVKELIAAYGSKSEFHYKEGSYFQRFNGMMLTANTFSARQNKLYQKFSYSDTLYFMDCSVANEKLTKSDLIESEDSVLNRKCKVLNFEAVNLSDNSKRTASYFFDGSLKVNPDWYKKEKLGSYDKIYPLMKSLPLKIVTKQGPVKITMTAIEIRREKVAEDIFQLPKGAICAPLK